MFFCCFSRITEAEVGREAVPRIRLLVAAERVVGRRRGGGAGGRGCCDGDAASDGAGHRRVPPRRPVEYRRGRTSARAPRCGSRGCRSRRSCGSGPQPIPQPATQVTPPTSAGVAVPPQNTYTPTNTTNANYSNSNSYANQQQQQRVPTATSPSNASSSSSHTGCGGGGMPPGVNATTGAGGGGNAPSSNSSSGGGGSEQLSKTNLYIRGLNPGTTDKDLVNMCQQFGTIISTKAILDKNTNKCKGYGFVDFESPAAAEGAVKALTAKNIQAQMAKVGIWYHQRRQATVLC
nr:unnamed protein product [Callosobruchus analis]